VIRGGSKAGCGEGDGNEGVQGAGSQEVAGQRADGIHETVGNESGGRIAHKACSRGHVHAEAARG
jgi:hypothetical protein